MSHSAHPASAGDYMRVGAALAAQWLRTSQEAAVEVAEVTESEGIGLADLLVGERRALAAVVPLFDPWDVETHRAADALRDRLAAAAEGLVLWAPPGARLPAADDEETVSRILEAAAGLRAGERGEVRFPVTMGLRKIADEGSYLSVQGGLSPHWARFTGQVFGQYQLDSSAIHRLPADEATVTQLLDYVVLAANGIRGANGRTEAQAEDAWTLQRAAAGDLAGAAVVVAAPEAPAEQGTPVRKALRAGVQRAITALDKSVAALRLVMCVGVFRSMREETASIALRGMAPATFAHFDAALLAADGEAATLFGPARPVAPEAGTA